MSCERLQNQVKKCAVKNGLSAMGSRAANLGGQLLTGLERGTDALGSAAAPGVGVAMRLGVIPSKSTRRGLQVSGVAAAGVAGFVAGRRGQVAQGLLRAGGINGVLKLALRLQPQLKAAYGVVQAVDKVSSAAGSGAAMLSYNGAAGRTTVKERRLFLFEGTRRVDVWRSRLTGVLNRSDQLSRNVVSSRGVMFKVNNSTTWHSGTSVVQTSAGTQTITHLRSLNLMGRHYYFDRPLSARNAAGIAAGQLDPTTVPGFKGQVSGVESLVPAWASLKHALIRAHLHWPEKQEPGVRSRGLGKPWLLVPDS
jgi:hypothetical protein